MVLRKALIAFAIALLAAGSASAQIAGTANLGGPQPMVSTPIPDGDFAAVAKKLGLVESAKPARELIKGWRKPRKLLVGVDNNTNRLAWLQAAAPGVKLVAVRTPEEKKAQIADADALLRMPCNREDLSAGKMLHWIQQGSVTVAGCLRLPSIPMRPSKCRRSYWTARWSSPICRAFSPARWPNMPSP
jgi:hypothetical protein